jgi:protein-disulfide isomerase
MIFCSKIIKSPWGVEMKKALLFPLFLLVLGILPPLCSGKELPKIAVWDLLPRGVNTAYAQELTSILVSEISKIGKYEVYSQENVRTLAGWTAERMALGCTDAKCLTALGQMDVTKLISGSVGKIGNTYSVSLNLFDTLNARAEKAVSEFCRTEDELIPLIQVAVRKLLGEELVPAKTGEKPVGKEEKPSERPRQAGELKQQLQVTIEPGRPRLGEAAAPITIVEYSDFQCSYCVKAAATLNELTRKYPGKIRIFFKHFPLTDLSRLEAKYFEALALQSSGLAWRFYEMAFANQQRIAKDRDRALQQIMAELGADLKKLSKDLNNEELAIRISQDAKEAREMGFQGVPVFLINGISLFGSQPLQEFERVIRLVEERDRGQKE